LAQQTTKGLAAFKVAEEYAHFGTELSAESEADLVRGKNLYQLFNQAIGETYNLVEQQFLLDIVINLSHDESVDIPKLKELVKEYAAKLENDDDPEKTNYEALRDELKEKCHIDTGDPLARKRAEATQEASDKASGSPTEQAADAEEEKAAEQDKDNNRNDKENDKKHKDKSHDKPENDKPEDSDKKTNDKPEGDEKDDDQKSKPDKPKHKLKVFGS
jgi:hypothetical protein